MSPFTLNIMQLQGPDALATLSMVLASLFWLIGREKLSALVFVLCALVRPDLEVFCLVLAVILLVANIYADRKFSKAAILLIFSSVIVNSIVYSFSGASSYLVLAQYTLNSGGSSLSSHFNIHNFIELCKSHLQFNGFYANKIQYIVFFLAGLGVYFTINKKKPRINAGLVLYLAATLYSVAHVLMYAFLDMRYFVPIFSVGILIVIDQFAPILKSGLQKFDMFFWRMLS